MEYRADDATSRFTYGDYLQWDDDERWELIDGRPYAMAAPTLQHQRLVSELGAQLILQLRGARCEALVSPVDVRLPIRDEPDDAIVDVVQPDVLVVCDPAKLDDRGCRGAPDFVIEVLSPSTTERDRITKLALYERAGVREYWLVQPVERLVTAHFREGDRFALERVQRATGYQRVAVLPGVEIDWDLAFARFESHR
jgi:Uma2 family endonuclease